MKKVIVFILTFALLLGLSTGVLAKGKPASEGKTKAKTENRSVEKAGETQKNIGQASQEEAKEINKAEEKQIRKQIKEKIRTERLKQLKNALQDTGLENVDDVVKDYQPTWGRFKVKGQHPVFDVPPVIKAGRTLIPVRAITQGLGAEVAWDGEEQKVTITRNGKVIEIFLGSQEVLVDNEPVIIDVPASMLANRVFVPIRFISETLGDKVTYDPETGDIEVGDEADEAIEGETDIDEDVIEEATDNEAEVDENVIEETTDI